MTKKLTSIKPENENISEATITSSKTCRILWPSGTTFMNIWVTKKILGYLYVFSIKTTWLKYTKTLIYRNLFFSNTKESLSKQGNYLTTEEYLAEIMTLFVKLYQNKWIKNNYNIWQTILKFKTSSPSYISSTLFQCSFLTSGIYIWLLQDDKIIVLQVPLFGNRLRLALQPANRFCVLVFPKFDFHHLGLISQSEVWHFCSLGKKEKGRRVVTTHLLLSKASG